jgi:glutathione S-transferase
MGKLILVIGNKNYSTWSMRAWLLLRWLGHDFEEKIIRLYREDSGVAVRPYSPTGLVPALLDGGLRIWDSFAIILHMADSHPEVWPSDPQKRAFVRSICAEMHSGFTALRATLPHNGRGRDRRVEMDRKVLRDIERIEEIWTEGRERFGADGPWLAGEFGTGDIMYAPVAARFRTYGVTLGGAAEEYRTRLLEHPLVLQWYADGADSEVLAGGEAGLREPALPVAEAD